MSDNPENLEKPTNAVPDTTSESTGKLFTQEQLDAVISQRLERERISKSQDIEELKGTVSKLTSDSDSKDKLIEKYEEVLKGILGSQLKELPKSVRELVEKLDPAEQLVWLENNADELKSVSKKPVPPTPLPEGSVKVDTEKILENKSRDSKYTPSI